MGNTFGFYNLIYRGVDFVKVEIDTSDVQEKLKFSKVVINTEIEDLYKIREILLSKKATPDNIRKLEQINKLIEEKSKRTEYMNRSLDA